MATDIEKLTLRMEANLTNVERQMNRLNGVVQNSSRRVENNFRRANRNAEASFQRLQRVAVGALGAIGVAFSARAVMNLGREALQTAENLQDLSRQVNANVEGLQSLRFAVDQNGGSADLLDRGLRRLAEGMGRVLAGETNEATRALDRLGLSARIQSGEIRTTDELFRALADALQGVTSQQERAAIASQIFGQRMGVQLSQALSLGSEGMAEFEQRARDAGLVLEEGIVRQGAEANAQLRAMGQELTTRLNTAVLENAEALQGMASALGEVLRATIDVTAAFARMFQEPAGRDAVQSEIDRLESRLNRLRQRGDASGAIDAIQGRIRELRARLELTVEFSDFKNWWDGQGPNPAPGSAPGSGGSAAGASGVLRASPFGPPVAEQDLFAWVATAAEAQARLEGMEEKTRMMAKGLEDATDEIGRFNLTLEGVAIAGIKDLEQAFVEFTLGAENSFDNFARAVLANLARMAFQQVLGNPLQTLVGSVFGGGKAEGGPVRAGVRYRVGERGPENFIAPANGFITPNPGGMGAARASQQQVIVRVQVDEGPMFASRVENISAEMAGRAVPVSVNLARDAVQNDMARAQRRRLR